MFTLFDLFQLVTTIIGILLGISLGLQYFGGIGIVLCGTAGFFVGGIAGKIPYAISCAGLKYYIKKRDTAKLKEDMKKNWSISHWLMAELIVRGEDVESFWPYIMSLLGSDSSIKRSFGWRNMKIWFPRHAETIKDFNPNETIQECKEELIKIESADPKDGQLSSETTSNVPPENV